MNAVITKILNRHRGDSKSLGAELMPVVYSQLKSMAVNRMRREGHALTLQPTALVNEAYIRLLDGSPHWENRLHFFAAAAEAMRRILIEQARRRTRLKRGGSFKQRDIDLESLVVCRPDAELLDVHRALERFEILEPRKATVVKMKYFLGMSIQETAEALNVSTATVKLDWAFAKAWLWRDLTFVPSRNTETSHISE